jgi:hypothetical protein
VSASRAPLLGPRQRGLTTVEFALIGLLTLMLLFAVIEFGRALFVMNALEEATRRGVRVAVVCPVGNPTPVAEIAVFNRPGGGPQSSVVGGLTTGHVRVDFLGENGAVLTNPAGADYGRIRFVRVRIQGFEHRLLIPLLGRTFTMPPFPTTLPRESLGVTRDGVVPC